MDFRIRVIDRLPPVQLSLNSQIQRTPFIVSAQQHNLQLATSGTKEEMKLKGQGC